MDPVANGILLGLANTVVIAVGLSYAVPSRDMAPAVIMFGFMPGMLLGALVGGIAGLTAKHPSWVRLLLLAPIPMGFVYAMATGLVLGASIYGALIPTAVAVLIMERSTRAGALVPRARVT
jgi:uncharacterized membrane protein